MKFHLITDHPIAKDSLDHLYPDGTARDNSANYIFNKKLFDLFPGETLSVLDLGCSGGGFVKTVLEGGHISVGIEGSDYSLIHQRAEWANIPDNLFTCDITRHFILHAGDGLPYQFDVITAWEVLEHIKECDLVGLLLNVRFHLKCGGLFIGSTTDMSWKGDFDVEYHQTIKPIEWWIELFERNGFVRQPQTEVYFGGDWVRSVQHNFVFRKV